MKKLLIILLLLNRLILYGQISKVDSLQKVFKKATADSTRVYTLLKISVAYFDSQRDTAMIYAQQALQMAKEKQLAKGQALSLAIIGNLLFEKSNYVEALETHLEALKINERIKNTSGMAACFNNMAMIYEAQEDYANAINYYRQAKNIFESRKEDIYLLQTSINIGYNYINMNRLDSALFYLDKAYTLALKIKDNENIPMIQTNQGEVHYKLHNYDTALKLYKASIPFALQFNDKQRLADAHYGIAEILGKKDKADSSILFAKQSLAYAIECSYPNGIVNASTLLSDLYESQHNIDSAYSYYKKAVITKDTMFNAAIVRKVQIINNNEQLRKKEVADAQERYQNNVKLIASLGGLGVILLVAIFLYRNIRQKQKANALLEKKNKEIQSTLGELKATQAQLVQREKMASLGELTAGIAHEIQNPLNFVNNFSELSEELCSELEEELNKPPLDIEYISGITKDLKGNLEKIHHHGGRADAIVKGMLQHSKGSSGQRELIDINTLADDYLRVAYRGFRARDKNFNVITEVHFDDTIEKINVVPADISRVLLNIFNNAFYAVNEKKKSLNGSFEPVIILGTKNLASAIEINIRDNGTGIPQNILNKIYQPFFTTKPTGEGTGLGLSLSYDIITKGHGGDLLVTSAEGSYTEFVIHLPK